jgi:uncharacterized phiE125 gp8 family phage protein
MFRSVGPSRLQSLTRIAAPAVMPISIAELKAHSRIDNGIGEDAYLTSLLAAVVSYVDGFGVLGRSMITQTWSQAMQYPNGRIKLDMGPVQSLVAVRFFSESTNTLETATLANYRLFASGDWAYVEPIDETWPTAFDRPDAVRVEFVAGYGSAASDVPEDIRHAMMLLAGHWYENRESASAVKMSDIPIGFEMLMNNHRLTWY